jgi:hypothetical protein
MITLSPPAKKPQVKTPPMKSNKSEEATCEDTPDEET